jgi:precorrin-4/cobalt-precorrin-4 C11-methyltransferase
MNLLRRAEMVIYTGSLVNPEILDYAPPGCRLRDSSSMTLEEVVDAM